ncbi:MAG: hypothetical protein ACRDLL_14855 [Solirubrobacterales bacterium]
MSRPILAVDIDGVISLFGSEEKPDRAFTKLELVDGVPHLISLPCGERLQRLGEHFELVWASGWEDKANFYLPALLGLPELPHVSFDGAVATGGAHWKLGPLEEYSTGRALAWIDDNFDQSCFDWAEQREHPTLLVPTETHLGLEEAHVAALEAWATSI